MAIRLWAQKVMDLHVQSLLEEARATPEHDSIPDDVCREIWQEVEDEYKDKVKNYDIKQLKEQIELLKQANQNK